jgi:P-type Ca2+ transporter type 2C
MLWTNIIMDILGALALGTEAPRVDGDKRISRKDAIVTNVMWRGILCIALYEVIIMLLLMYFGQFMFFDHPFNLVKEPLRSPSTGNATGRLVLNTIMFYTFILMNLFNQFNCRVVDDGQYNIFFGLWKNPFFILVVGFEFFLTWFMVDIGATDLGSALIGTANITPGMHLYCWLQGASVWLVGLAIKKIPAEKFDWITSKISLEDDNEDDPLNKLFKRVSEVHGKVRKSISGKD